MTRLKTILAGICTGMTALGMLGAFGWYFLLADEGPQMLNRKWYVSGIEHLRGEVPPGDVWQFPPSLMIEPLSVQRVEWSETAILGRAPWGYILYYKARVKDAQLSQQLRAVAEGELRDLPKWSVHAPKWWKPQRSIPRGGVPQLDLRSHDIFIDVTKDDVFIYWIVSHQGYI